MGRRAFEEPPSYSRPPAGGYHDPYGGGREYSDPRDSYSGSGGGYGGGYGAPSVGSGCVVSIERLPPSATTARLRNHGLHNTRNTG